MRGHRFDTPLFCAILVLAMTGSMTFPALIPVLKPLWGLTGAEAGWIGGVFFFGHMLAVPVTGSLCDRMDPRRVVAAGLAISGLAAAGFAFSDGFVAAMLWRGLAGIGLAGVYIPALNALTDRVAGPRQSRHIAFYTASYAIGTTLSVFLTGRIAATTGWESAALAAAAGPVLALALLVADLLAVPAPLSRRIGSASLATLLDFRPVFRNRPAMGYILAYTAHMWELHAYRTWLVAFLAVGIAAAGAASGGAMGGGAMADQEGRSLAADVATLVFLLGLPASVLGNELAMRLGRRRTVTAMMLLAAAIGASIGWSLGLPLPILFALAALYGMAVMWDSAALTAGMVAAVQAERKGATMAAHACLGFLAAAVGPVVVGQVLDLAGGAEAPGAFGYALLSAALVAALGPIALLRLARGSEGR